MNPYFMERTAKIVADVRTRMYSDKFDAKVIEDILQKELNEYHNEVFIYGHSIGYDDGYDAVKSSLDEAAECAYYEGYDDGLNEAVATEEEEYSRGFEDGRAEAESDNEAYTREAVESAYKEGYSEGYSDGVNADFKRNEA